MDGIMPTVWFLVYLTPILLACAIIGAIVGYRDLPNQGKHILGLVITTVTVWACIAVSWYAFMPSDADWLADAASVFLAFCVYTGVFIAGAKTGERRRQPRAADHGSIYRQWEGSV